MSQVDLIEAICVRFGFQGQEGALRSNLYLQGVESDDQLTSGSVKAVTVAIAGLLMTKAAYPLALCQRAVIHLGRMPDDVVQFGQVILLDGSTCLLPAVADPRQPDLPNGVVLDVETLRRIPDAEAEVLVNDYLIAHNLSLEHTWAQVQKLLETLP